MLVTLSLITVESRTGDSVEHDVDLMEGNTNSGSVPAEVLIVNFNNYNN